MSTQLLAISNITIHQDSEGRYCLNDLHKASGNEPRHKPAEWLRLDQTKELISEVAKLLILPDMDNPTSEKINDLEPVKIVKGFHEKQGTYVVKPLVYAYAMWISPRFHLQVINAYDALVSSQIFDFLTPITEPITLEDFDWRYQVITQALNNLKNATVLMKLSGAELLAGKCFDR